MNETCEICETEFTRRESTRAPKGRPWKHVFCGQLCYDRWRANRHLEIKADWLKFQRKVWGTAPFAQREPMGKNSRHYARQFEIRARDIILPDAGFSEIDDMSGASNMFFADFIATHQGRRVLADATVKLKAYVPEKMKLALSLRMPLFIVHVSPKNVGLFHINEVPPGNVVSRVPASIIRSMTP